MWCAIGELLPLHPLVQSKESWSYEDLYKQIEDELLTYPPAWLYSFRMPKPLESQFWFEPLSSGDIDKWIQEPDLTFSSTKSEFATVPQRSRLKAGTRPKHHGFVPRYKYARLLYPLIEPFLCSERLLLRITIDILYPLRTTNWKSTMGHIVSLAG